MKSRLAKLALVFVLFAVVGWPTLATVLAAWRGSAGETGGGLIGPSASDLEAGRIRRPFRLAAESARVVLATEAIALPLGITLALILFRTDLWGRRAMLGLISLAVFVPIPLHAVAWLGALGNAGRMQAIGGSPILVGWAGAAFVHAMAAIPWVVLLAGVGLRAVEPELEETALLEQPAWRVLAGVTLRRAVGALAGASLVVAVLVAGDMTVTDLLQVRTYAEESYVQYQLGQGAAAAVVSVPPLLLFGGLIFLAARGLLRSDPARLASAAVWGKVWRLGLWRVPLGLTVALSAGNLVALPLYGLVWRAGRVGGLASSGLAPRWSLAGLIGTLSSAFWDAKEPIKIGLFWSVLGASATVALAWALAWVARKPGVWRWVVAAVVALTLATPGPVTGMALVLAYQPIPTIRDSPVMFVMADLLRTLPYAVLVLWPSIRTLPSEHFDAAALDGYGDWGQVRRIALPMTRRATLAAWGVSFALALGELPTTILVSPPGTRPISEELWSLLHTGVDSHLAGVAIVMLAVISTAGSLAAWGLGRVSLIRPAPSYPTPV
jgi:iron(III) transport system permease protein